MSPRRPVFAPPHPGLARNLTSRLSLLRTFRVLRA
jgi:hypothetical protein